MANEMSDPCWQGAASKLPLYDLAPITHTVIVLQDDDRAYYEQRVLKSERDKYPMVDYRKAYSKGAKWK